MSEETGIIIDKELLKQPADNIMESMGIKQEKQSHGGIELINCPIGTYKSGQACLAMICGVSIKQIDEELGSRKDGVLLKTKDLVTILKLHKIRCEDSLRRVYTGWQGYTFMQNVIAIVRLNMKAEYLLDYCKYQPKYYWVLHYKRKVFDPYSSISEDFPGRTTSFLRVWPREK